MVFFFFQHIKYLQTHYMGIFQFKWNTCKWILIPSTELQRESCSVSWLSWSWGGNQEMLLLLFQRGITAPECKLFLCWQIFFWGKDFAAVTSLILNKVSGCKSVKTLSFLIQQCQEWPKNCSMSLPQCVSRDYWRIVTCNLQGTRKSFYRVFQVESICIL